MGFVRNLEAVANVAIVVTLLWPLRGRIRAILSSIPRPYALVSVGSLVALLGAQRAGTGEALYPLTDWSMYSSLALADPQFVDYIAVRSSGREERLHLRGLFPLGGRHLRMRIDDSARAIEQPGRESSRRAVDKLDVMLAAIASKHDSLHPGDPVRTIHVYTGMVSVGDHLASTTSRRLIHEYHAR